MNDDYPAATLPKPMRWRLFFVLWIGSVVGLFFVLPYAFAMIPADVSAKLPSLWILVPAQVLQSAILLGLLTLGGLFFANRTGLGAPIIEAWLDGQSVWVRLKPILLPSVLVGIIGTLVILGLEVLVFQPAM